MKLASKLYSFSVVNWWIYAYYNTHDDCRSHTGFIMSPVKGGTSQFVYET